MKPRVGTSDLAAGEEIHTSWGPCLQLAFTAADLGYDGAALVQRLSPNQPLLQGAAPAGLLFLDLETCALKDAPLFLCGLARLNGNSAEAELFLARNLSEEPAVIAAAAERLADAELLVTYNGARFDLPYLAARARYFNQSLPRLRHLDLLPICRERFKRQFGNCKLRTVEAHFCGHQRDDDDPPGAAIPGLYNQFVFFGDATGLWPVLRHNGCDLLSMVDLLGRL